MATNQSYNDWIKSVQEDRNNVANWRCNVTDNSEALAEAKNPPEFPHVTLFQSDLVESYAVQMSSKPSSKYSNFTAHANTFSFV